MLFIFIPTWGRFPFWLIFFKGVQTTNQHFVCFCYFTRDFAVPHVLILYSSHWLIANGTKRKLKTLGFIEAKETQIDKCKYFCLDQSWQKKPQKSWIGWIFPEEVRSNHVKCFWIFGAYNKSSSLKCPAPFSESNRWSRPSGPLGSVPFSGPVLKRPEATNSATNTSLEVFAQHFIQVTLPGWPFDFPPPGEIVFLIFFLKGERKESEGWAPKFSGFAGWCFNSTWTKLFSLLILHMSNQSSVQYLFLTFGLRCLSSCSFDINFLSKTEKDKRFRYTDAADTLQMQQIHCRCSRYTADAADTLQMQLIWISDDHRKSSTFRDVSCKSPCWNASVALISHLRCSFGVLPGGGWTESSLGARDFLKYVGVHFSARKQRWLAGISTLNPKSVSYWKWWCSQPVMLLIFNQHWGWPRSGKQVNTKGSCGVPLLA